jgi:hypothetical protein
VRTRSPSAGGARPHQEEHQRVERRCRQEKADRQNRGGGEKQVDHDAGEEEDEREHQGDTESAGSDMAHEPTVGGDPRWSVRNAAVPG